MRISRHNLFMETARLVARRGTCPRLCVGAVLVENKRPISWGYNGAPSGEPHCTDIGCTLVNGSCVRADHAELNALRWVPPKTGARRSLYITHSPCKRCAEAIVKAKVDEVYFETPYKDTSPLLYLLSNRVQVYRLMPNGYLFDGVGVTPIEIDERS